MTKTVDPVALAASASLAQYEAAGGECHSIENQRILSRLVEREVLHCLSSTVAYVAAVACETPNDAVDYDEVLSLCTGQDWETPGTAELEGMDQDDLISFCDEHQLFADAVEETPFDSDSEVDHMRQCVRDMFEADWKSFCENRDIDPEDVEVYEHWAVTSWFKKTLAEHNQITGEMLDFDVWGRCTTGQAISMDGCIAEIAASMQILDGQAHSWKD